MVFSHTVLTIENMNAPNSGCGAFAYICTEPASGLVRPSAGVAGHVSCGWSHCIEILVGGWNLHTQQWFQLVPDTGWVSPTPAVTRCLRTTVTLLQVYLGAMGDAHVYASLTIQLNSMVSGDLLFDQLQEHLFVMTQSMVRAIKSLPQMSWKHLWSRHVIDGSWGGRAAVCTANPVLGSSFFPVWLTGVGTGLLKSWRKHGGVLLLSTTDCLGVHKWCDLSWFYKRLKRQKGGFV